MSSESSEYTPPSPKMVKVKVKKPAILPPAPVSDLQTQISKYIEFLKYAALHLRYRTSFAQPEQYKLVIEYLEWITNNAKMDQITLSMLRTWVVIVREWV